MRKVEVYVGQLSNFNNQLAKEQAEFGIERAKFRQERPADEVVTVELRQRVKQLEEDRKWLIGSGIVRFVTYLLHSQEFNFHLVGIYSKAMAHGRHTCLILPAFKPDSLPDFVGAVKKMEALSYPYVEALFRMVDYPIAKLEALEPACLNKELCEKLLSVAYVKGALFGTSDEEGDDVGHSSKRLKVILDPEPISSMSIPVDAPPLSSMRGEPALLASGDDEGDDLDGLYDDLPLSKNPLFGGAGGSRSAG
ncbi:hypothetical protein Hanom_Chr13g01194221 [Helianthus anomalus]